jgi:hypothetical protein
MQMVFALASQFGFLNMRNGVMNSIVASADVFVSYSRSDAEVVDALVERARMEKTHP